MEGEITVTIELLGLPRILSGERVVTIKVDDEATLRDVVVILTERFPDLLGPIVDPETYEFRGYHFFNREGRRAAGNLDEKLKDGNRFLLLLSVIGGG